MKLQVVCRRSYAPLLRPSLYQRQTRYVEVLGPRSGEFINLAITERREYLISLDARLSTYCPDWLHSGSSLSMFSLLLINDADMNLMARSGLAASYRPGLPFSSCFLLCYRLSTAVSRGYCLYGLDLFMC